MPYGFMILALFLAVLDWVAVDRSWKTLGYFTKPGVMLALLAWLWQVSGFGSGMAPFAIGLLFSMAGDVFLMLPRERFIAGLVAFLLAHVAYIVGFNPTLPPINLASLIVALLIGAAAWPLYQRLSKGLVSSGHAALKPAVLVYATVISLMLFSALLTLVRPEWDTGPAFAASSGALLFFLSDTFLAWNKFVAPIPNGRLRVRITYHLGQALIVLGAAVHFLPSL